MIEERRENGMHKVMLCKSGCACNKNGRDHTEYIHVIMYIYMYLHILLYNPHYTDKLLKEMNDIHVPVHVIVQ